VADKYASRPDIVLIQIDGEPSIHNHFTAKGNHHNEEIRRLKKRRQIETAVTNLTALATQLFGAWILYHFVTLALSGLAPLAP
jgi:hypothetical protein